MARGGVSLEVASGVAAKGSPLGIPGDRQWVNRISAVLRKAGVLVRELGAVAWLIPLLDGSHGWCSGEEVRDTCTRPNGVFAVVITDSRVRLAGYDAEFAL